MIGGALNPLAGFSLHARRRRAAQAAASAAEAAQAPPAVEAREEAVPVTAAPSQASGAHTDRRDHRRR